jgi:glycosyltransferase involved in cell wall biosynthesis
MSERIDRVVVISDDSVESGGAASVALGSMEHLRRRGIPVTLLTGDDGSNPDLAQWGVDVLSLGGRHLCAGNRAAAALRGLYDRRTCSLLQAWIDAHDTPGTVYHLHNWHKVLSPSALLPLRRVASRLVISAHDFFLACPNGGYFHFPHNDICDRTPMTAGCVLANCDKRHYGHKLWRVARHRIRERIFDLRTTRATVLAVHEGMASLLERGRIPRGAICVLRNPVSPWRQTRVPAERNQTVLFVGRLELDKGVDTLVRAAAKLETRLRLIGDGSLRDAIGRNYPKVELLGSRPRQEIGNLVADVRMLVLPTRVRETFGLVALEGAMSGIPVIVSQSVLIGNELVQLGIGKTCRPDAEDVLAQQIASLMQDDALVGVMSRLAFETARALAPTPEEWCDRLLSIYEYKLATCEAGARSRHKPDAILRVN